MIRMSDPARALLASAAILMTGVVAGVTLDRLVLIPAHGHASIAPSGRAMAGTHDEVIAELTDELSLTPRQADSLRAIFAEHQAEIDRIWAAVHADLQGTIAEVMTELEAELDDDQVRRLHAWVEARHGKIPGHPAERAH